MKKVAVEKNLGPIQQFLSQQGYQVEALDASNMIQGAQGNQVTQGNQASQSGYSAIVISGADRNLMGMENMLQNCPVINASGLTPQQVFERLQQTAQ